jgi:hypothetical protein
VLVAAAALSVEHLVTAAIYSVLPAAPALKPSAIHFCTNASVAESPVLTEAMAPSWAHLVIAAIYSVLPAAPAARASFKHF